MKRIAVALLCFLAMSVVAAPARAYCVVNKTPAALEATLLHSSPLADFRKIVKPGQKVCCDWFDRRCNPTARRDALVTLTVETPGVRKTGPTLPGLPPTVKYVPIPTFDRYGNPDPNGHYDRFGVYDEHGHKPYFERIETFDEHGNPDPNGHYDRYGVYDANGHRGRRGQLVIPKGSMVRIAPEAPQRVKPQYCSRGRARNVLASADGTVTVATSTLAPGGLKCESRDRFLRPVRPPSQAQEFGVPLLGLPAAPGLK